MSERVYVYKIKAEDLPWIQEVVLVSNNGDLFEYSWAAAYIASGDMHIVLHTSGFIEATSRPYWAESVHLIGAEEFKEKVYETMLTA